MREVRAGTALGALSIFHAGLFVRKAALRTALACLSGEEQPFCIIVNASEGLRFSLSITRELRVEAFGLALDFWVLASV